MDVWTGSAPKLIPALKLPSGGSPLEKGTGIPGELVWAVNSGVGRDGKLRVVPRGTGKCPGMFCPWMGQREPREG